MNIKFLSVLPGLCLVLSLAAIHTTLITARADQTGADRQIQADAANNTHSHIFEQPILNQTDQRLYRQIFELQHTGRLRLADQLIRKLSDKTLMGHVKYQRYMHPTAHRSSYEELHLWMKEYADHPGAHTIYKLAQRRRQAGWKPTPRPRVNLYHGGPAERIAQGPTTRKPSRAAGRHVWTQVKRLIRRGGPTAAERLLKQASSKRVLPASTYDYLAWRISRSHFVNNNTTQAFRLAQAAANRSAPRVPLADWIAGLAAWQLGQYEAAIPHFERLAQSESAPAWARAGAAFWAARSAMQFGDAEEIWHFAEIGARQPTSFYSLLCRELLGWPLALDARAVALTTSSAIIDMWQSERIRRARAAAEIGRDDIATNEVRAAFGESPAGDRASLLALVPRLNVPAFAMQLGRSQDSRGMPGRLALQYPVPRWQPEGGFNIDRALVFALIRQESRFRPRAKSPAGARGLMQLMPRTASYVSGNPRLKSSERHKLFDPAFNMALGQDYVQYLMKTPQVGLDLLHVTAAYNGGPGSLQKWQRTLLDQTDPLLFVETIPHKETRHFVHTIMTNIWVYRILLNQPAPSLTALAQGHWPLYTRLDQKSPARRTAIRRTSSP